MTTFKWVWFNHHGNIRESTQAYTGEEVYCESRVSGVIPGHQSFKGLSQEPSGHMTITRLTICIVLFSLTDLSVSH